MLILRELLFKPNSRFTDLNIKGLSSDHFSYHINTLIEEGLVSKNESKYSLSIKGKEFANTMDTDEAVIEKQPKIAVILIPFKIEEGKKILLLQQRLKEPYYGYNGFLTGKIRFGEKIKETALRELQEETGLSSSDIHIKAIVHDHVILENGDLVEDKLFFITTATNLSGELISTQNGKNYWATEEEFFKLEKKYYNEDMIYEKSLAKNDLDFLENIYTVETF
jgi:8-oxo-dGTP pyrophosphatase MutT (NUDIX family)